MNVNRLSRLRTDTLPIDLVYVASDALGNYPVFYLGQGRLNAYAALPYDLKQGHAFNLENGQICAVRAASDKRVRRVGYLIELRGAVHFIYDPKLIDELGTTTGKFETSFSKASELAAAAA